MMRTVERGLLIASIILMAVAVNGWLAASPRAGKMTRESVAGVLDGGAPVAESIDATARVIAATDPFRLDRHPTSVPYRPDLEGVAPPPAPPRASPVLKGLVGGTALIDGIPGRVTTAILRVGDTLGGLRVRRIGRDTVVLSSTDTTWHLTLRRAWH